MSRTVLVLLFACGQQLGCSGRAVLLLDAAQRGSDGSTVDPTTVIRWVTLPKGTFLMGSPQSESCRKTFEAQHQVTLTRDFEIQSTEVTQAQFLALMGYNPAFFGPNGGGANCGTNCPVETVRWHEAAAYCNALSQQAGKTPCYRCYGSGKSVACHGTQAYGLQKIYNCPGYRLPTEAEWEYAYRAGTKTAYHSGPNEVDKCVTCKSKDANADTIGWYCANAGQQTHPVGKKQKNAWELYDMAGNVAEWCHDRYQGDLGAMAATDPWGGADSGSNVVRVLRGGWSLNSAGSMRAAYRDAALPHYQSSAYGFRCSRTK